MSVSLVERLSFADIIMLSIELTGGIYDKIYEDDNLCNKEYKKVTAYQYIGVEDVRVLKEGLYEELIKRTGFSEDNTLEMLNRLKEEYEYEFVVEAGTEEEYVGFLCFRVKTESTTSIYYIGMYINRLYGME